MKLLSINNFDIYFNGFQEFDISERIDVFELKFIINENIILNFPLYKKTIKHDIIQKFEDVLNGKNVCINLNMLENLDHHFQNYNYLNINKEYFEIISQTIYNNTEYKLPYPINSQMKFENNNIFRNSLRDFLISVKKIINSEMYQKYEDILENYYYYHGVYFPRKSLIPSKDQINFLDLDKIYQKDILSTEKDLSIDEYREKFGSKNNLGIYIYNIFNNTFSKNLETIFSDISNENKIEESYWEYHGVLIPNKIDRVPAYDQINTYYRDGYQTKLKSHLPNLNISEYRKIFSYKDEKGNYIFKIPGKNIKNPQFKAFNKWVEYTWYSNSINNIHDQSSEEYSDDFESDTEDEFQTELYKNNNFSDSDNYSEVSEISTVSNISFSVENQKDVYNELLNNFDINSFDDLEEIINKQLKKMNNLNIINNNIIDLTNENIENNISFCEKHNGGFYIDKTNMIGNSYYKYFQNVCNLEKYFFININEIIDFDFIYNIKIKLSDQLLIESLNILLESSDFEIYYINNGEIQKLHYNFGNIIIPIFLLKKHNGILLLKIYKYTEIDYFEMFYDVYNILDYDKENLLKNTLEYQDKNNKFIFLSDGSIIDNNR